MRAMTWLLGVILAVSMIGVVGCEAGSGSASGKMAPPAGMSTEKDGAGGTRLPMGGSKSAGAQRP